jgi:hypothetical protein
MRDARLASAWWQHPQSRHLARVGPAHLATGAQNVTGHEQIDSANGPVCIGLRNLELRRVLIEMCKRGLACVLESQDTRRANSVLC